MIKKYLIILISLLIISFGLGTVFSDSKSWDSAFSDIRSDYKYYDELKVLYEKGMIFPDNDGNFNPNRLLNRDEFVGISIEVGCKQCIRPNIDLDLIQEYESDTTFFDVEKTNKYFYCIAYADDNEYVVGYDKGYVCEDKTHSDEQRPYCVNNKITLEEAVAVILRNSGIFTIEDNKRIMNRILEGESFPDLAKDLQATNFDGTPYTFYGYFQKALSYKLLEYDNEGNQKLYQFLNKSSESIRPKRSVSKEEFLIMAYVALKANSCNNKDSTIDTSISIYDYSCSSLGNSCNDLDFDSDKFDFKGNVKNICSSGISDSGYSWVFSNNKTGEDIIKTGSYIENFELLSSGEWIITLKTQDNCGNTGESMSRIFVSKDGDSNSETDSNSNNNNTNNNESSGLSVVINANPSSGPFPLQVDFESTVWGDGDYEFQWDFGDSDKANGKEVSHTYFDMGTYKSTLNIIENGEKVGSAYVTINVTDNTNTCETDLDGDGVVDCKDRCVSVEGNSLNNGCPLLFDICDTGCACDNGFTCNSLNEEVCSVSGICLPDDYSSDLYGSDAECLLEEKDGAIFGNTVCNSCPCPNYLDFSSTLRKCDHIFPAITSPDGSEIYSKGPLWKVQ